jgi:hypothetical protein
MQVIDAAPYRGKRVRFRGAVRTEVTSGRGKGAPLASCGSKWEQEGDFLTTWESVPSLLVSGSTTI